MDSTSSSAVKAAPKTKTATRRALAASEIARNVSNFETWSTHQCCDQVSYSDLPEEAKSDVAQVFDVTGMLPKAWVDRNHEEYQSFRSISTRELRSFLLDSYKSSPSLFSTGEDQQDAGELYADICFVFTAWTRLKSMRGSKEKWSEADLVANVYNLIRSPAVQKSIHRVNCTISLPQPPLRANLGSQAVRILNAKTVVPDCAIFVPAASVRSLSQSAKSPFKILKSQTSVAKTGSPTRGSSFSFQSTPRAQLPDTPGFEFISSVWEDKKSLHLMLEDAYRQNRMSTASAARHLHSLHIKAPVFGLVWSNGTVRAHVDWCKCEEGRGPVILSAPYPGDTGDENNSIFHEWELDEPSDILQIYLLIRNIDNWTMGPFRRRVVAGVNSLLDAVVNKKQKYEPWRRSGDLGVGVAPKLRKENTLISITTAEPTPSPPTKKGRTRRRRS